MAPAAANRYTEERAANQSALRRVFDWLFRDRRTGKVVIAQLPNLALSLFLVAIAIRWLLHPAGMAGTIVSAVAALTLAWWGVDEVARGVNPFRRALGAVVLATIVASLILS
jgi:hypothetical protein